MTRIQTLVQGFPTKSTLSASREVFGQVMLEALHEEAIDPMMGELRLATPYPTVAEAYEARDVVLGSTGEVRVDIYNHDWVWPFQENDQPAHWPPWGPDSRLETWSFAHNVDPFLVARAISIRGTFGNYIFQETWETYQQEIRAAVQTGLRAYIGASFIGRQRGPRWGTIG